jgi:glycine/D-amino acid oxidase-like deaminating enzyme
LRLPGPHRRRAVSEADAAVVGSGLPAILTALELARRGASVVVVGEADPSPRGLGLALLGPGRPYRTVAHAIGRAAAQLVWAAGCENQLRLKAFVEAAPHDLGYRAAGSFLLARTRVEAEALEESEDMLRDDGFPGEFLDHYMLETRFDLSGFPAGYWAAGDAEVDALLLREAAQQAARDARVAFRVSRVRGLHAQPSGVRLDLEEGSLRVAAVVVAADACGAELVPEIAPLVRPSASARLTLSPLAGATLPSVARTADGQIAWRANAGSVLLAETAPFAGTESGLSLRDLAMRLPLDLASATSGEEPAELSLDGLPVVGLLEPRPLAVACGFSGLAPGFAFAAARWVADALLRGTDPTPEALRATRAAARLSAAGRSQ